MQENIYGRLYPSPQDNFFALLRSCKIIYQGIEDIHRIHIMTVKSKKYLNKVIYNASLNGWLSFIRPENSKTLKDLPVVLPAGLTTGEYICQ